MRFKSVDFAFWTRDNHRYTIGTLVSMLFWISKILEPLERPDDALMYLLILGAILACFRKSRKAGAAILGTSIATIAAITLFPIPALFARPLENRFPRPSVWPVHVDGIIVLGGAVDPYTTAKRGLPSLNSEAERMTEFVRLAKLYPSAKLVFSGGSGILDANDHFASNIHYTEADVARLFFRQQGIDLRRVIFEHRSRNTFENVEFSKQIVKPRPGEAWLLVQTAMAVPRSVGIFSKARWPVQPIPVAYKSTGWDRNLDDSLFLLDRAAHEWEGLLIYRLTGKTDQLFPSPSRP
jgi:uncharacterized SAM-binding protein YcdF (DUF218 family)